MKPAALFLLLAFATFLEAATPLRGREIPDPELDAYFRRETSLLAERPLPDLRESSASARKQLAEMLGLDPMPMRGDLEPVITARLEHENFTVENLHFQSLPGLYVTANLYLPKLLAKPAPTVLYVCGHAPVVTNGISYGNKTFYQHHGIWFAQNGYVCLIIDTLQLGEIEGLHYGTYRAGMWWWNSRGYTPAGVETWNGIRALDYLSTRPEVDTNRFAMTGRSGGGAYSWFVAALDERVKVVAPVAGITDLENHVADGCIEGHCDCMFFVNTWRWDYQALAALVAPRPLLVCNTDSDTIFPLDGVIRIHSKVRAVYEELGAKTNLGLVITPGPHKDTQELQLPVLRWFNRYLKNDEPLIETAAMKLFPAEKLRVLDSIPKDAMNTNIHHTFLPAAKGSSMSDSPRSLEATLRMLREKSFAGWPTAESPARLRRIGGSEGDSLHDEVYEVHSQQHVRLQLGVNRPLDRKPQRVVLRVLGAGKKGQTERRSDAIVAELSVRGAGALTWSVDAKKQAHIRRRFMLLGQTLDGMRVWDIRRAIQAVRAQPEFARLPLRIEGAGDMAVNALYAALFEGGVAELALSSLPSSHMNGPDYLNVLKILDLPDALALARERTRIETD